MANLAGFDVIAQAHIETVVDLLNLIPLTNPVDGKRIHLFGGPFSTDFNVNLGPFGSVFLRIIVNASLRPVEHQSRTIVEIKFSGGSTAVAGRSLTAIGGRMTVTAPLGFALLPTAARAPDEPQVPNFVFSGTDPQVTLDAATRAQADAIFGVGGAILLAQGLRDAFAALLDTAGTQAVPAMGFKVFAGTASTKPDQLSAPPLVAWIDSNTLAVFGYYRIPAIGGDVTRKTDSNIVQPTEEDFYDASGATPGRRVALLLSAEGFRRVVACPTARDGVIRGIVAKRGLQKWKDFVTTRDGDDSKAQDEMDLWLQGTTPAGPETVSGKDILDANMPPPCGERSTEIERQSTAITQSDVVVMLRRFGIALQEGRVAATFNAEGNAEIITGDVSLDVDGEIHVSFSVNGGVIISRVEIPTPSVTVSAGGLTALVLGIAEIFARATGLWDVLMNLASIYMRYALSQAMTKALPHAITPDTPQDTLRNRMVDIQIHADSVVGIALVSRHPSWNDFRPALFLDTTVDDRTPVGLAEAGQLNLPKTDWGCPAAQFTYVRSFWDEIFTVKARARDIPLPIGPLRWRMELGNISETWLLGSRIIDPRITWSGDSKPVSAGESTLHVSAADARVVSGDAQTGWRVRLFGADGNFYVRFILEAQNPTGRSWTAETILTHRGEQLELPPDYETYRAVCAEKFQEWFSHRVGGIRLPFELAHIGRGDIVMNKLIRDSIAVRDMVSRGDLSAVDQIQAGAEEFGVDFLERIGQVHIRGGI